MSPNIALVVAFTTARWWAAAATVAVFILAVLLIGSSSPQAGAPPDKRTPLLLRPFLGADGRVSTSHTVALAWAGVVAYLLVALIIINPANWSGALKNLSPTYLLLLGFPFASLVLAKATVASRVENGSLLKTATDQPATLSQLFSDDAGNTDAFDVQYVLFNVIAMIFVIVQFGRASINQGFPEIPNGIILLTGGPAAVYLTNKFMPGAAPAIFTVSPTEVRVGQSFTVVGQNLASTGAAATAPRVLVGSSPSPQVPGFTPSSVIAVAPDVGADLGSPVDVAVTGSSGAQAVITGALRVLGRVPTLDGANRGTAQVDDKVVLRGDWNAEEAPALTVLLDAGVVGPTSAPAEHEITFVVPQLANLTDPRPVSVKVKLGSEISNAITLAISPRPDKGRGDGGANTALPASQAALSQRSDGQAPFGATVYRGA